jgi:polyhydroxyalkanoate synthase
MVAAQTTARPDPLARVRRDVERSLLRTRNGLKLLSGVGRPTLGQSPKETVWSAGKVELWRYRSGKRTIRPPLFFVHSLVSRSYVFDLAPGNSFVEFMLNRGFDVFLVNWGEPDEEESTNTLETYCDEYLPELVQTVRTIAGTDTVTVFGYCFGGLLSLLYAAGHPGDPVSALAVMATPVHFREMGPMSSLLNHVEPDDLIDGTGNVPAEVILNSFRLIQPTGDLTSYANLWQHLWNDEFVTAHQTMTQWAKDHIPFPGACFKQTAQLFARDDCLAAGQVPLGGRTVDLRDITVPFVSIIGEKDHIVPPAAVGSLAEQVGSDDAEELRLPAGHVGLIVGRAAQKRNLGAMADWLERHSEGG